MTGPRRRTCARCSRHGYPAAHFPDGYLCRICLRAGLDIRGTCPGCGTHRALPGLRSDVPVCTDCAGISRHFTCLHCGYEGNLPAGGRLCGPCGVTWQLTQLLDDGTGTISPALQPLATALTARTSHTATVDWLTTPHVRGLLSDLATGKLPLTHQALAAHPHWRATIYLRDLLTGCGVLPATDRQLLDYERWLHQRLQQLAGYPHQRLLRQFGLWHQLPKMRAKAAAGPLRPTARKYAELQFIHAATFLTWAAGHGRRLPELTQADLDTWHATAPISQRQAARGFLNWAMDHRHLPRCQLPTLRFPTGDAITQHRRLALLRHYLTGTHTPLRPRTAACLMLLYAQPLSRVLRLAVTDITRSGDGQVHIRFGHPPAPVPEPFAGLLLQLIAGRPATSSTWLFPGRNPGQPAAYATVFTQLRGLGFPMRTARISALRQLVLQAPAPVIAEALGFHYTTTERQHANAGATWNRYPTGDHTK
jgi:hypothetical protein